MMSATLIPRTRRERDWKRRHLLARARAIGWSQSEIARRIGRDVAHVSRVLRGITVSAYVWAEAERLIVEAETAEAPAPLAAPRQSRRRPVVVAGAI